MSKKDIYRGLYNPYTDRRTVLNPPLTSWESQWDSLGHRVQKVTGRQNDIRSLLDKKPLRSDVQQSASQEERPTVNKLQTEMPGFAKVQVQHLYAMLNQMNTYSLHLRELFAHSFNKKLTQSRRFSPSNVNRSLLRQVTTDLRIIEQAISQRLPVGDTFMWDSHMLYLSDLMAYDALQPLKNAGIVPQETAIVTYMQRQTDIRMAPYYNAVLLGLPSSTSNKPASPPDEFLAIPHEIGHYLYRYGALDRIPQDPHKLLAKLADGAGWSAKVLETLQNDDDFIAELRKLIPDAPVPCIEMAAKVREIFDLVKKRLAEWEPVPTVPASSTDSTKDMQFTPQLVQRIAWRSITDLLLEVQKALPLFTKAPDHKVTNWEIAQALQRALRALGVEDRDGETVSKQKVKEVLDAQDPDERFQEAQQINAIAHRARIEDIITSIGRMLETMPEMSPDRNWVLQLYHGLLSYQKMPKEGSIIPLPEKQLTPPTLELHEARRLLTPRVHEILTEKLEQRHILPTDWRSHWVEELFCDAYGCLVAGPINVLGFQILLSDEQYENDHLHRGKHPVASLRPFILSEMLREMDRRGIASYKRAPDLLDLHWQNHLRAYGEHDQRLNILETQFTPEGQMPSLTGQQIIDALQIIIDQIFDLFADIFGETTLMSDGWKRWTNDICLTGDEAPHDRIIAGVMRQFQNQFDQYYHQHDLSAASASSKQFVDHSRYPTPAMIRATTLAGNLGKYGGHYRMPVADWFEVFAVDGWSTEGPHNVDDGG